MLTVERVSAAMHPIEGELLAAVRAGDDASRMVYADWLDENGDPRRAELLRVQALLRGLAPTDEAFADHARRLRQLAFVIDPDWRVEVAVAAVEGCDEAAYDFACPRSWASLAPTAQANVRSCGTCGEQVYYCQDLYEARTHAKAGHCVVVDVTNRRAPDDLVQPPSPPQPSAHRNPPSPGGIAIRRGK